MANDIGADPPFSSTTTKSAPDALIDHAQSIEYWNSVSPDTNGMLGGFPQISAVDLQGSFKFLAKLRRRKASTSAEPLPPLNRVADCGAGVGRITRKLLLGVGNTVHVIEPVKKFTD